MGRKKSTRDKVNASDESAINSPFAALNSLRDALPNGEPGQAATSDTPEPPRIDTATKIIVSKERKGRGGKTVTLIQGVPLTGDALVDFAARLRKSLGTGGSVDAQTIVLSGDLRERCRAYLEEKGFSRIKISGA